MRPRPQTLAYRALDRRDETLAPIRPKNEDLHDDTCASLSPLFLACCCRLLNTITTFCLT